MIFERKREESRRKDSDRADYFATENPRQGARASDVRRGGDIVQDARRIKKLATICAVSVALALVSAAYGTWAALSSQAAIDAVQADTLPTLTVLSTIKAGEVIDEARVQTTSIPRGLRIQGAYVPGESDAEQTPLGKRALVDLPAGFQLTPSVMAGSKESGFLAASLDSGMQAVTVAVDAETGLAGQLRPADRVRVVAEDGVGGEVRTVCENVRVVALDGSSTSSGGGYSSVTIEVSNDQANAVRAAQYAGGVSFVLFAALDSVSPVSQPQSLPESVNAVQSPATLGLLEGQVSRG